MRVSVSREEGVSRISCTGAGDAVLATAGCGLLLVTSQNPPTTIAITITPTAPHSTPEISCSRCSGVRAAR